VPRARHEYKAVWTEAAVSVEQARSAVAGEGSEASFWAGGAASCDVLLRTVGIKPEDVVLEIGCGVGRVGRSVAPLCREWIGCDVSPTMLEHAGTYLADLENVRLVETSGFDLAAIASESVDVVYCMVVFMHLDEWDRYSYVAEGMRVLAPGGRIYIDNFNLCSDEGWALFEQHRAISPEDRPPHVSKSSTPQELETYLRRAGFDAISLEMNSRDTWVRAFGQKPRA
jgi:ubiquinone/menaquinone biosynthesis C-methylase UbiE